MSMPVFFKTLLPYYYIVNKVIRLKHSEADILLRLKQIEPLTGIQFSINQKK